MQPLSQVNNLARHTIHVGVNFIQNFFIAISAIGNIFKFRFFFFEMS